MTAAPGQYPSTRMRRLRAATWRRRLVRETVLTADDLILPLFVVEGTNVRAPIASLPRVSRLSIDQAVQTATEACKLGIPAVASFPALDIALKDSEGREALNPNNLVCRAVKAIKSAVPELGVVCDVALDPYTTHGHDGIFIDDDVVNDATVAVLVKQALVLAEAGCDVVVPSDMMDGRIGAIRQALEKGGHVNTMILSYAVKYASAFYGPFRDAVGSKGALGTKGKHTYQMDAANVDEALREAALDVAEGADMVMVKPGMPYLDVIAAVKAHVKVPVLAYQVSGEYAMLANAALAGAFDYIAAFREALVAFKRAGSSAILTYAALDIARDLAGKGAEAVRGADPGEGAAPVMFPIMLGVSRLPIMAIGGDGLLPRLAALAEFGATAVHVFAPAASAALRASAPKLIEQLPAAADFTDIQPALAFISDIDDANAASLAAEARCAGALVHVQDRIPLCDFHLPARLRRGHLQVSVSTDGTAAGLARLLRDHLADAVFGPEWEARVDEVAAARVQWKREGLSFARLGKAVADLVAARGWLKR